MKVFISWSGKLSHKIALKLKYWIPAVIHSVDCYVSSEDIDKGACWEDELAKELTNSNFGILCITKNNSNSPWLNFEAGAISKFVGKAKVCTLLYDVKNSEIKGPLGKFQATKCDEEKDFWKLIKSINKELGKNSIPENKLETTFNMSWVHLKKELDSLEEDFDSDEDFDCEGKFKGLKELNIGVVDNSIFEDIEHSSSIDILANTSKKLLTILEDRIIETVKNGCDVRIAISSPENSFLKDKSVGKGLCKRCEDITEEINGVINQLQDMVVLLKDQKLAITKGSIEVRTFSCVPTCGIIIINNKILRHTPYLPYSESFPVPTFDIVNRNGSKLFGVYKETFNRVWENSDYLLGINFKIIEEFPKQMLK